MKRFKSHAQVQGWITKIVGRWNSVMLADYLARPYWRDLSHGKDRSILW